MTWYRADSPKWGRGFDLESQIRLATKREITKYKLAGLKGNLITSRKNNSGIFFCQSKEGCVDWIFRHIENEVSFAEYRLRYTTEQRTAFLKEQEEERKRKEKEVQMVRDSRGLGI